MKKFFQIILLASLAISLTACDQLSFLSFGKKETDVKVSNQVEPGQVAIIESDVIVTKPLSNDTVSSPLKVVGRSKTMGSTILFRLKDGWGDTIVTGSAITLPEAGGWGAYSGQLDFEPPLTPIGSLEVYSQNAQDDSDQNIITLPINFENHTRPVVKVYFNNTQNDPELTDCGQVYSVDRFVDFPAPWISSAVVALVQGPTPEEQDNGFMTNIPTEGIEIKKLDIREGIAYIDFNQVLQQDVAGACRVTAIRAQITETLKQFEDINEVVISIEGETEDILQP